MFYYQMELCTSMYKHVYWLCAPHSYNHHELPVLAHTPSRIRLSTSTQTAGTKKPAEHPVRGLKPVHHLSNTFGRYAPNHSAYSLCLILVGRVLFCVCRVVVLVVIATAGRIGGLRILRATELALECAVVGLGAEVLHLPSLPCCFSLLTAAPHGVTPSFILSEANSTRGASLSDRSTVFTTL